MEQGKLISDMQAAEGDVPEDWTWIQTDIMSRSRWGIVERSAYRTRDGFYFIDMELCSSGDGIGGNGHELVDHGIAKQVKTVTYVPGVDGQ